MTYHEQAISNVNVGIRAWLAIRAERLPHRRSCRSGAEPGVSIPESC